MCLHSSRSSFPWRLKVKSGSPFLSGHSRSSIAPFFCNASSPRLRQYSAGLIFVVDNGPEAPLNGGENVIGGGIELDLQREGPDVEEALDRNLLCDGDGVQDLEREVPVAALRPAAGSEVLIGFLGGFLQRRARRVRTGKPQVGECTPRLIGTEKCPGDDECSLVHPGGRQTFPRSRRQGGKESKGAWLLDPKARDCRYSWA